jgi:hypothetical protein
MSMWAVAESVSGSSRMRCKFARTDAYIMLWLNVWCDVDWAGNTLSKPIPSSLIPMSSEIRRKLVIVGDGACGKVNLLALSSSSLPASSYPEFPLDLPVDRLFQGHIPRGRPGLCVSGRTC